MALINASSYGSLSQVSIAGTTRKPVKFFNVFISGKRRGKINPGMYQCPKSFDNADGDDAFILNQSEVYFIPLYMKKYWAKYVKAKAKDGTDYDNLVAFGWQDGQPKPDQTAKYEYIVAGYLYDNNKKSIVKHTADVENTKAKAGDSVLVYFRCKGSRCSCAFDLVQKINNAAKSLNALSDNPTFEQNVINPRRFLIKATIESKSSNYGPFDVFKFEPATALPDNMVQKILDAANKELADFNEQFDKTDSVGKAQTEYSAPATTPEQTPATTKPVVEDVPDVPQDNHTPGDDFDIDL